jgi:hypothetical protein
MTSGMVGGLFALLLIGLSPAVATAQSVRGQGEIQLDDPAIFSPSHISVNASFDDQGNPQGSVEWTGDSTAGNPGGPAEPVHVKVTFLAISGNTAYVEGVVTNSPKGVLDGNTYVFTFTDNSGTDVPDEIDGIPITAGNITVSDS